MSDNRYRTFDVDVHVGKLSVGLWEGRSEAPVLGTHGITGTHMAWSAIAEALTGKVNLITPDLRGRGGSNDLPGPYGMGAHVDDCLAVLDHLELERVAVAGMSMGGYVATLLAARHPDRVESVLLIDGGIVLPVPPGIDPDDMLEMVLGPSFQRLRMVFASRDEYHDYWKAHPALSGDGAWNRHSEAFVDDDLTGKAPEFRSKTSEEAVRGDGRDLLTSSEIQEALSKVSCPIHLVRSPRGLQNQPEPTIPDFLVDEAKKQCPQLTDEMTEDNNHYTLVTGEAGAGLLAERILQSVGKPERTKSVGKPERAKSVGKPERANSEVT
jgi:lipase